MDSDEGEMLTDVTHTRARRLRRRRWAPLSPALLLGLPLVFGAGGVGCLSRPVAACDPSARTTVEVRTKVTAIDKIDLLFAIDNSQSMGDKQALLARAVPDLVNRLLQPNCVDDDLKVLGPSDLKSSGEATCAVGKLEFAPVRDLHVGILTSSIGGAGGNTCVRGETVGPDRRIDANLDRHNDDGAHLINRSGKD